MKKIILMLLAFLVTMPIMVEAAPPDRNVVNGYEMCIVAILDIPGDIVAVSLESIKEYPVAENRILHINSSSRFKALFNEADLYFDIGPDRLNFYNKDIDTNIGILKALNLMTDIKRELIELNKEQLKELNRVANSDLSRPTIRML